MFKKTLEIHKKLGDQEGLANDYANLGSVYEQRGDKKKAREYWEKAVGLYKKIGMKPEIKKVEGLLEEIKD